MTARTWMSQGTSLFLGTLDGLADDELDRPTGLPGWTRRHVVAHVHYNAEALRRLVHWARTGEQTPMYRDAAQRAAEIEAGAQLPARELRALARSSADALATEYDALPQRVLGHEVTTAQGRVIPAIEIPWLRTREVAVHTVDLDAGAGFTDLPDDLNTALVADAAAKHCGSGMAAPLAAWLTGRGTAAPELGTWI